MAFATAIINSVTLQAKARRKQFQLIDVCRDAIVYWPFLHHPQRKMLAARIERVIETLLIVGFPGQFQIKSNRKGFVVEVTPAARRSATADSNAYSRKLDSMAAEALDAMNLKLQGEAERGEQSLFPGTALPATKSRKKAEK